MQVEEFEPRNLPSTTPLQEAIPGLFSTGVDNQGHALQPGRIDPHYQEIVPGASQPAATYAVLNNGFPFDGYWLPNNSASQWIDSHPNVNDYNGGSSDPVGPADFRTTFDLSGLNWRTAQIQAKITGDNTVTAILLNGHNIGYTSSDPEQYRSFSMVEIDHFFKAGINQLDFIDANLPQPAGQGNLHNPAGFRAELSGTVLAFAPEQTKDAIQAALKKQARDAIVAKKLKISVEKVHLLDNYARAIALKEQPKPSVRELAKIFGQSPEKFHETLKKYDAIENKIDADELRDQLLVRPEVLPGDKLGNLANNVDKARMAVRKEYPTPDLSQFNKLNELGKMYKGAEKELDAVKIKLKLDPEDVKFLGVTGDKSVKGLEVRVFSYAVPKQNVLINVSVEAEAEGGQLKFGYTIIQKIEFKDVTGGVKIELKR